MVIEVDTAKAPNDLYAYKVVLDNYKFRVTFSEKYYQKLTSGKMEPEVLVEKSFAFLLEREPVTAIMPKFDLSVIQQYFSEFEAIIRR